MVLCLAGCGDHDEERPEYLWIGYVLAGLVAALASLWVARKDKKTKQLMAECRLAVRDLKRFRELEDRYASELACLKREKPEALRRKMRKHDGEEVIEERDRIGTYGEPVRIDKLLRLLDNA